MSIRSDVAGPHYVAGVARLVRSRFAHNYAYYSAEIVVRLVLQLGYLVVVTRALGVTGYGRFAAVVATASVASVLVAFGVEQVLLRRSAGFPSAVPDAFGHTLLYLALSLPPILFATFYAAHLLSPELSPATILWLVLSEVLFARLMWLVNMTYLSQERAGRQTFITLAASLVKLSAAALMLIPDSTDPLARWAVYYFISSALGAGIAILMLIADFGAPSATFHRSELRPCFQYGLETISIAAFRELDKPIVFHTLGPEVSGLYAVAWRIADTACFPLTALLRTVYARYFVHARDGTGAGLTLALYTLAVGALISLAIGVALFFFGWVVPIILGAQFSGVIPVMQAMAILPAMVLLSGVAGDLLRSLELLRERFYVWTIATLLFAPICYLGVLAGGSLGAALARSVNQLLLGLLLWATIFRHRGLLSAR